MDLYTKCSSCTHFNWEHDLGGDTRGCRYCMCVQSHGAPTWMLRSPRYPSQFTPKPDWLKASPVYGSGLGFAGQPAGQGQEGIFILAESLGEHEEYQSKPLVGPTGQFTARMISRTPDPGRMGERLDLDRDFIRSNVVPIKPPFNKLDNLPYEIKAQLFELSRPLWTSQVAAFKPRAIFALGDHALVALTGRRGITKVRGCVFDTPYGFVIPTLHPSYLLHGKIHLTRVWQTDLKRALYVARNGWAPEKYSYIMHPTPEMAWAYYKEWVAAGRPPIAFDIETPHASVLKDEDPLGGRDAEEVDLPISEDPSYTILEIGFAWKAKHAIHFPYTGVFREVALRILAEAEVLYSWNGDSFDVPRVVADGAVIRAQHIDLMRLWHVLEPALPMGLKHTAAMFFFDVHPEWASKEMAKTNPPLYNCHDNDFTFRLGDMLTRRAKEEGKWDLFMRQYVLLGEVLRGMTKKGVKTDPEIRKEARDSFQARFKAQVAKLQTEVPLDILPRKTYKLTEEQLRKKVNKKGESAWAEGRMIEVLVWEKPPKPKKKDFKVFFMKQLKKGPKEASKKVKAFTLEEAMGKIEGALRAEEV